MKWLNYLERKMGRHYIPDLMKYLCLAMLGVFILDYLPGSVVLCGAKRPDQILSNAEGLDWMLTEEELKILEEVSNG